MDWELWSDRFNYKEDAESHAVEQQKIYPYSEFTVTKMTKKDFIKYD